MSEQCSVLNHKIFVLNFLVISIPPSLPHRHLHPPTAPPWPCRESFHQPPPRIIVSSSLTLAHFSQHSFVELRVCLYYLILFRTDDKLNAAKCKVNVHIIASLEEGGGDLSEKGHCLRIFPRYNGGSSNHCHFITQVTRYFTTNWFKLKKSSLAQDCVLCALCPHDTLVPMQLGFEREILVWGRSLSSHLPSL